MASFGSGILMSGLTGTALNMGALRHQQRYRQQQFAQTARQHQAALEAAWEKLRDADAHRQSARRAQSGAMGTGSADGSSLAVLRGLRETAERGQAELQRQARRDRESLLLEIAASRAGYRRQMAGSLLGLGRTLHPLQGIGPSAPSSREDE